jgi:hypothetical protein
MLGALKENDLTIWGLKGSSKTLKILAKLIMLYKKIKNILTQH